MESRSCLKPGQIGSFILELCPLDLLKKPIFDFIISVSCSVLNRSS